MLVAKTDKGEELTEIELISMMGLLLLAGHETTTGALGNSIIALSSFPGQRTALRKQPTLIGNAVNELLRFDTSVLTATRIATEEVEVGGKTIPTGSLVVM